MAVSGPANAMANGADNRAAADDAVTEADELYAVDLDEFVAARNALVKRLKAAKDKEAAARVQALQKPSVTAWAVNQVARRHPDDVAALLDAGEALRRAQEQALSGDATAIRTATRDEQQQVAHVSGLAGDVLRQAGREPTPAQLERVSGTLRAAAAGGEAADLVRAGRVTTDLSPAGFGLDAFLGADLPPAQPATRPRASARTRAGAAPKRGRPDDEDAAGAKAAADRAAAERIARLREEAGEARRQAESLEREADQAEDEAAQAEQAARVAEDAARAARHRARDTASAAVRARRDARAAEERADKAAGEAGSA